MSLVRCPSCETCLRVRKKLQCPSLVTLSCPVCKSKFKLRSDNSATLKILLAHEDRQISQQLFERLNRLGLPVVDCRDCEAVFAQLKRRTDCLLLLDVAFGGTFPFTLIQQAKEVPVSNQHKVVLLPSIYNRTAYKKKPTSLYGADGYLELHHIGDRLLPLVAELYPAFRKVATQIDAVDNVAAERPACGCDLVAQATTLSQLLVADIVFYHHQEVLAGLDSGHTAVLLRASLAEGRRMLRQRLPEVDGLKIDFISQAFNEFCRNFSANQIQAAEHAR